MNNIITDGCEILGQGYHSTVYKLDDERVAKVYNRPEDIDMANHERTVARQAFVKGVPTEISFGMCECNGKPGLIYELVDSETLLYIFEKDAESIDRYVDEYVKLVKKLHSIDPSGFENFGRVKNAYLQNAERLKPYLDDNEFKQLMLVLDSVGDRDVLLHGDPHPANVMTFGDELIFIDLSDMSIGNELFDLVYLYRTLILFGECDEARSYKLSQASCSYLWQRFFDEYFKDRSDCERNAIQKKIRILGLLSVSAYFIDHENEKLINVCLNKLKGSLSE